MAGKVPGNLDVSEAWVHSMDMELLGRVKLTSSQIVENRECLDY